MKLVSLVCVYNNHDLVNSMVESCKNQTIGFENIEFILIDSAKLQFSSAASALNYGVSCSTADNIIFLHQDIEFLENDAVEYILNYLNENPQTIVGAAGVKSKETNNSDIISSMYAGCDKSKYKTAKSPQEAFVLDECLFACNRNLFDKIKFDEKTCNGWHLYAADLCLQALINNFHVTILPLSQVWHKSNGNVDKNYFDTQNLLAVKYRKNFKIINTTNSYIYTNPVKRFLQNLYHSLRYNIK